MEKVSISPFLDSSKLTVRDMPWALHASTNGAKLGDLSDIRITPFESAGIVAVSKRLPYFFNIARMNYG